MSQIRNTATARHIFEFPDTMLVKSCSSLFALAGERVGPAVAEERREDPGPERVCGRCAPGSAAARARAGFRSRSAGQTMD